MNKQQLPAGWDEDRVRRLIDHYENMSDDEMIAEDEAAHKTGRSQVPIPGAAHKVKEIVTVKGTRDQKKGKQPKALRRSKRRKGKGAKKESPLVETKVASKG